MKDGKIFITVWYPSPSDKDTYRDVTDYEIRDGALYFSRVSGEKIVIRRIPFKVVDTRGVK